MCFGTCSHAPTRHGDVGRNQRSEWPGTLLPRSHRTGGELAVMPLGPGEDARTGPGARSVPVVRGLVQVRPGTCAPRRRRRGDGGQDGPR
jgi:hypothetical protein